MEKWFNTLKQKVIGAWGAQGEQWLEQLPAIVGQCQEKWSLTDIKPIDFPSYNYVAFCNQQPDRPVVLKISCDAQLIADEYKTHQHFNGQGAIRVFAYDDQLHAVLLERAVPGDVLKALDRDQALPIYANIVKQLQSCEQNNLQSYQTSDDWLKTVDRIEDARLLPYVPRAKRLINFLNEIPEQQKICHADLHLENIILHGDNYLAIDPKGVVGELAFEASAFDLLTEQDIATNKKSPELMTIRIAQLAKLLNCDKQRLSAWYYLRLLIGVQWFIEDQLDPSKFLYLLEAMAKQLSC